MARLLVVDDEPNVRYSIKKQFESDALEVAVAETGRQGLELARQFRPDAVILDVRLADTSGIEVFDRIRELDPRLPVIIITAYAATETAIEATKRGAFECTSSSSHARSASAMFSAPLRCRRLRRTSSMNGSSKAMLSGGLPTMSQEFVA